MTHSNRKALRKRHCFLPILLAVYLPLANSQTAESASHPTLILEVIQLHFTMGKKIPSVYLRLFSDGTAECHALRQPDGQDVAKQKTISVHEYEALKTILEDQQLLQVKHRYELMHPVFDSWTEWNITIKRRTGDQAFEVSGFSPTSAYPKVLTKLGCSIWKLRREVYGDVPAWLDDGHIQECKDALEIP
jgi:hypothetical protein